MPDNIETEVNEVESEVIEKESKETPEISVEGNLNLGDFEPETKVSKEVKKETEEKEGILTKIKNIISGKSSDENIIGEAEVPDEFVEAYKAAGYTEDDLAEMLIDDKGERLYTDEELIEMIPYLSEDLSESVESEKSEETKTDDKQTEKKSEDKVDEKDEVIKKLTERISKLEKADEKNAEKDEQELITELFDNATQVMDELSNTDEFEVLGKFDKLPRFPDGRLIPTSPQVKARVEIWDTALKLYNSGVDFDKAMEVSTNAYKGKNLSTTVHRKMVKDLRKSEKKISPKRTSHESANANLTGVEIIGALQKKHGRG